MWNPNPGPNGLHCRSVSGRSLGWRWHVSPSLHMTPVDIADYLAGERLSETRHEYVDGELFEMIGASRAHARLSMNLAVRLGTHLEGGPCRVALANMKVRPAIGRRFHYPDLVVSCNDPAEEEDEYVETHPTLIVEVLSESTERTDRREKRLAYQSIDSLREYVLVAQDRREVSVYLRDGDGWMLDVLGSGERVVLGSVGLELDIDDLYRGVDVPGA